MNNKPRVKVTIGAGAYGENWTADARKCAEGLSNNLPLVFDNYDFIIEVTNSPFIEVKAEGGNVSDREIHEIRGAVAHYYRHGDWK